MIDAFFGRLAEAFDLPVLDWIQSNLQSAFMDFIMPIITLFGDAGIFWIACSVILLLIPKYRKAGLSMGIALLLGLLVCNVTMKPLFARIRPYDYKEQYLDTLIPLLVERQHDFSFPSGHTIASFEACTALMLRDKRLGIPATLLAILILAIVGCVLYIILFAKKNDDDDDDTDEMEDFDSDVSEISQSKDGKTRKLKEYYCI